MFLVTRLPREGSLPPFQAIPILALPEPPELAGVGAGAGADVGAVVGAASVEDAGGFGASAVDLTVAVSSMWAFARDIDVAEDLGVGAGTLLLLLLVLLVALPLLEVLDLQRLELPRFALWDMP